MRWMIAALLATALSISTPVSATASDLPVVVQLEMRLQQQGIGTDTLTLMAVARWSGNFEKRWSAIEILGLRSASLARGVLRRVLNNDRDPLIRETAALALARLGDEAGKVALEKLMFATTTDHRRLFLAARLAEFGNPVGYGFVLTALKAEEPSVRLQVVEALVAFVSLEGRTTRLAPDPSLPFMAFLNDDNAWVRMTTLTYLSTVLIEGHFARAKAKSLVEELARREPDLQVREFARTLLRVWEDTTRR